MLIRDMDMVIRTDFQLLVCNPNNDQLMKKKDLDKCLTERGNNSIIVQGTVRSIRWKSFGAGWYRVYTTPYTG